MAQIKKYTEDDEVSKADTLGYYVKSRTQNCFTVFLDEPVVSPGYYRNVVNMMIDAGEEDKIIFMVNSPGGQLNGLTSLIEALRLTDATTIAVLTGETHSAASIFSLHCNVIQVLDSATMLCHSANYGVGGKANDISRKVAHEDRVIRNLLQETYKNFLTDDEINQMIEGKEFWLDADEIRERLNNKLLAETPVEDEQGPEVAPKRKPRKAKAPIDESLVQG